MGKTHKSEHGARIRQKFRQSPVRLISTDFPLGILITFPRGLFQASRGAEGVGVLVDLRAVPEQAGGARVCVTAGGCGRSELHTVCFALQRVALACATAMADVPWT